MQLHKEGVLLYDMGAENSGAEFQGLTGVDKTDDELSLLPVRLLDIGSLDPDDVVLGGVPFAGGLER